jgi:molecular chaperone Hsp33
MTVHSDFVIPFQLDKTPIRGGFVRLNTQMRQIIDQHNYPPLVNRYLSESVALTLALINCFKFDGLFTFQISSSGPLRLVVVDVTKEGHIRACARFDEEKIQEISVHDDHRVQSVFGAGQLAFTIEPEDSSERYQGIVELTGATLSECLHHFFRQSEQIETGIVVVSQGPGKDDNLVASALMIQRMPTSSNAEEKDQDQIEDDWFRSLSVLGTLQPKEMLDPALSENVLLYRLFWENGIRIHTPKAFIAQCRCSRERIQGMLMNFNEEARQEMVVDGKIDVKCEFCGTNYRFDESLS